MDKAFALKQFPYVRRIPGSFTIFFAIALVSCGGGGGGSGGNSGNQPPVATAACSFTPQDTPLNDRLLASDPNNDSLTFAIAQQGTLGRAETDVAGNYRYTPNTGARGQDSFVFRVTDTAGNQATANVKMIVGYTRIMPLGDSITTGVTVGAGCSGTSSDTNCPPDGQRISYRKKLYDDLTTAGYRIQLVGSLANGSDAGLTAPNDRHEGHGGFQDSDIRDGVIGWLNAASPDVVLLHAGTNGINNVGGTSGADLAHASNSVLERIFTQWVPANHPVTVLVAKLVGSPDTTTNDNIIAFNTDVEARINQNWSTQVGAGRLVLVDIYSALANRTTASGGDFADALHPNATGYQKMADAWRARLLATGAIPSCP